MQFEAGGVVDVEPVVHARSIPSQFWSIPSEQTSTAFGCMLASLSLQSTEVPQLVWLK